MPASGPQLPGSPAEPFAQRWNSSVAHRLCLIEWLFLVSCVGASTQLPQVWA